MSITKQPFLIVLMVLLPWMCKAQKLFELPIKIKVVDETGLSIENAIVGVGFEQGGNAWIGEHKGQSVKGESDSNGVFYAEAKCTGSLGVSAKKEGYYAWWNNFYFYRMGERHDGDWKPFDPKLIGVTAILRYVGNPVSMYAKKVLIESEIPIADNPVGYDLMIGDWVAPYGKGKVSDFVFLLKRRVVDWKDFETHLSVWFSNPSDGIQSIQDTGPAGSTFRLPRTAPETSYQTNWSNSIGYIPNKGYFETQPDNHPGYCFRVRSARDEKGSMIYALYGKIKGPIRFDARDSKTAHIAFTYYLNPAPNDRNLEFDPKQNLMKNLKPEEYVREP